MCQAKPICTLVGKSTPPRGGGERKRRRMNRNKVLGFSCASLLGFCGGGGRKRSERQFTTPLLPSGASLLFLFNFSPCPSGEIVPLTGSLGVWETDTRIRDFREPQGGGFGSLRAVNRHTKGLGNTSEGSSPENGDSPLFRVKHGLELF